MILVTIATSIAKMKLKSRFSMEEKSPKMLTGLSPVQFLVRYLSSLKRRLTAIESKLES